MCSIAFLPSRFKRGTRRPGIQVQRGIRMRLMQRMPPIVQRALSLPAATKDKAFLRVRAESARRQERSAEFAAFVASVCPLNLDAGAILASRFQGGRGRRRNCGLSRSLLAPRTLLAQPKEH